MRLGGLRKSENYNRNLGSRSHLPRSSIKGEVKKKHTSFGWNFSCFAAPLIERNLF